MQPFLRLREISFSHDNLTLSAYFEIGQVPLCFFSREISVQLAVEKFIQLCRSLQAVEAGLLDSLEKRTLSQAVQDDCDNESRLYVASLNCQDHQSLKLGMFVKGKCGWTVSTSERLQCYAYTPCTLLLIVPAGCRVNEACAPTSHLYIRYIFPMSMEQGESIPMNVKHLDSPTSLQPTPLGINTTKISCC